jgi:uncharacterized membrane protein
MSLVEIIFTFALLFAYLFISGLVAATSAKLYCYSDKTFTSLVYWLLVGLLATSQVFRL